MRGSRETLSPDPLSRMNDSPHTVPLHVAKVQLSGLLRRVEAGECVVITRRGLALAELQAPVPPGRRLSSLASTWLVPGDLHAALAADDSGADAFEGETHVGVR